MEEKKLFQICAYSHDFDGTVFVEKSCWCDLHQKGENYFIRRHFEENWDYKVVEESTEDIPIGKEDLRLGVKKLSAMYCHGRSDNPWIDTYRIHRDEDEPNQEIVLQKISKNS